MRVAKGKRPHGPAGHYRLRPAFSLLRSGQMAGGGILRAGFSGAFSAPQRAHAPADAHGAQAAPALRLAGNSQP